MLSKWFPRGIRIFIFGRGVWARERERVRVRFLNDVLYPCMAWVSPYWEYRSDGVVPVASGQTELVLAFSIYLFYSLFPNDRGNEIIWFRPPLTQHTHVIVSNAFCWRKMRISNANLSSYVRYSFRFDPSNGFETRVSDASFGRFPRNAAHGVDASERARIVC